jgi:Fe-S-cluster containining protein
VYVSPGDVRRIAAFTGQTDFFEDRSAGHAIYAQQDDDPTWRDNVFQPNGTRRVMRRDADGACVFLGKSGCRLPMEVRPLVCRIYPYDYDERGIKEELAPGCPLHLIAPGQTLLTELNMNEQDAHRWHEQLYNEIRQETAFRATAPSTVDAAVCNALVDAP